MELHPYKGIHWNRSSAKSVGKCLLSGLPIGIGDAVYVTDYPTLSGGMVLVDQYAEYERLH